MDQEDNEVLEDWWGFEREAWEIIAAYRAGTLEPEQGLRLADCVEFCGSDFNITLNDFGINEAFVEDVMQSSRIKLLEKYLPLCRAKVAALESKATDGPWGYFLHHLQASRLNPRKFGVTEEELASFWRYAEITRAYRISQLHIWKNSQLALMQKDLAEIDEVRVKYGLTWEYFGFSAADVRILCGQAPHEALQLARVLFDSLKPHDFVNRDWETSAKFNKLWSLIESGLVSAGELGISGDALLDRANEFYRGNRGRLKSRI